MASIWSDWPVRARGDALRLAAAFVVALAAQTTIASAAEPVPLRYEPQTVELRGVLRLRRVYGRPWWGERPRDEKKAGAYILRLPNPVSVVGEPGDSLNVTENNVSDIHVAYTGRIENEKTSPLDKFVGKAIVVRGKLFHQHTLHHQTKVLIATEDVSLAPVSRSRATPPPAKPAN